MRLIRLTRGSTEVEIVLSGVSAKLQPHGIFQSGRRCVETSGDVTKNTFRLPREFVEHSFTPTRRAETASLNASFSPYRDIQVNSGNTPQSAHVGYWNNEVVIRETAQLFYDYAS